MKEKQSNIRADRPPSASYVSELHAAANSLVDTVVQLSVLLTTHINVKKLNSLKRLVRTTVAMSYN